MQVLFACEKFWISKCKYENAERLYFEAMAKKALTARECTLVSEIAKAREHINNSLQKMDGIATLPTVPSSEEVVYRISVLEAERNELKKAIEYLNTMVMDANNRISTLEQQNDMNRQNLNESVEASEKNFDLFASDSEEECKEVIRIRKERLAAYEAKKSKKPALISKSNVILDVKPWDDETDFVAMESNIRKILCDGLVWGASKLAPIAFGIQKLTISCVVEDEKVSIDWLVEQIENLKSFVQSVDIAAFNKI